MNVFSFALSKVVKVSLVMIVSLDWEKPCHCSGGGEASFVHCAARWARRAAGQSWQVPRNASSSCSVLPWGWPKCKIPGEKTCDVMVQSWGYALLWGFYLIFFCYSFQGSNTLLCFAVSQSLTTSVLATTERAQ